MPSKRQTSQVTSLPRSSEAYKLSLSFIKGPNVTTPDNKGKDMFLVKLYNINGRINLQRIAISALSRILY